MRSSVRPALLLLLAVALLSLLSDRTLAATAGKSGVTASTFLSLTATAKELYVAGITDALDEAGLLRCPEGTSYAQVITLAEAAIYKARERADKTWAAAAVMQALKESGCGGTPTRRGR